MKKSEIIRSKPSIQLMQERYEYWSRVPYPGPVSYTHLLIVADDDLSGTFAFFRAVEDNGFPTEVTAEQIGKTWLLVDIVGNLAEPVDDGLVRPALHRAAQIHADHLAQNTGVNLVAIGLG